MNLTALARAAHPTSRQAAARLVLHARNAHPDNRSHAQKFVKAVDYLRNDSPRGWIIDTFIEPRKGAA